MGADRRGFVDHRPWPTTLNCSFLRMAYQDYFPLGPRGHSLLLTLTSLFALCFSSRAGHKRSQIYVDLMCKDVRHNLLKESGVDIKVTQQRTTTVLGTDERPLGPGRKISSLTKAFFQSAKLQTPISVSQNMDIQHLTPNFSPINPRPKVGRRTDLNYGLPLRLFLHNIHQANPTRSPA